MKNTYGKLTKKKAIEILYKYDATLNFYNHKILCVEIFKEKGDSDSAIIFLRKYSNKYEGNIYNYYISCFGISVEELTSNGMELITYENVLLESEKKIHE